MQPTSYLSLLIPSLKLKAEIPFETPATVHYHTVQTPERAMVL